MFPEACIGGIGEKALLELAVLEALRMILNAIVRKGDDEAYSFSTNRRVSNALLKIRGHRDLTRLAPGIVAEGLRQAIHNASICRSHSRDNFRNDRLWLKACCKSMHAENAG